MIEYNQQYKKFIDFLRLENDSETLNAIGYKEFYGEEYGLRKSYSLKKAKEKLSFQYNKTGKIEYLHYYKYIDKNYKSILYCILFLICTFLTTI